MFAQPLCIALIEQWKSIAKSDPKQNPELEVRSQLPDTDYQTVFRYLAEEFDKHKQFDAKTDQKRLTKSETTHYRDLYYVQTHTQTQTNVNVRVRIPQIQSSKNPEAIVKQRLSHLDVIVLQRAHDVRFSLKTEAQWSQSLLGEPVQERDIQRVSFYTNDHFRIDLSIVQQTDLKRKTSVKQYEIEVESLSEGLKANSEHVYASLQYWTLFWQDCLSKPLHFLFLPYDSNALAAIQKDKNATMLSAITDVLFIAKTKTLMTSY
jgi:hypothetical protein